MATTQVTTTPLMLRNEKRPSRTKLKRGKSFYFPLDFSVRDTQSVLPRKPEKYWVLLAPLAPSHIVRVC